MRRSRAGRLALRVAVPALVAGQLLVVATPAAAGPTPWRFAAKVTTTFGVAPESMGGGTVECPVSYVPVGGGLQSVDHTDYERVAEYYNGDRGYHVIVHNYRVGAAIQVTIAVTCALASHVGSFTTVSADLPRVGTLAGGAVNCPQGMVALFGGADWNTSGVNTRRIDLTSPTADGRGWYAAGESPVATTLHVEAYCIAASDIGVSPLTATYDLPAGDRFGVHQCPTGRHAGAGGVLAGASGGSPDPHTYRGHTYYSYPSTASSWSSKTYLPGAARLTFVTWCLPASVPAVTITQTPPARSNDTTPTFAYTATDPAGEAMQSNCYVDLNDHPYEDCPNGTPFTFTALPDGQHEFIVSVINVSGQRTEKSYTWTVDTMPPTATGPAAGASVSGPLAVTFSEPVTGVSTSSVQVRVAGQSALVPGSVTTQGSKALWVPASALVPGETYTVSITNAIKDVAGNAVAPDAFDVRTSRTVESTSAALREYWDRDSSSSASGGSYVESNAAGSSLTWRVSATSGQTASLYGVRRPTGGYGEVWVDGVKKATVSFYGASTAHKVRLYTSPALSAGTHTILVKALGTKPSASSGAYVGVDYLTVGSTVVQESSARHAFRRLSSSSASGGSYDVVAHRTSGDTGSQPAYSLTFKGTAIRLYVTRYAGAGPVRVYLDGVLKKSATLTSSSTLYKQLAYSASGLADARHTLKVVAVGTSSGSTSGIAVDYLGIT